MNKQNLVIVDAVRTPIGAIGGSLSKVSVKELALCVYKTLLNRTGLPPEKIQYTSLGWVMQDARFPNLAKIASELCGVPSTVPGTTFHENCASGAAAVHDIARRILVGEIEIGVALGVESMSNVPRYLYQGRLKGQMYGDMVIEDGIMSALRDNFVGPKGEIMGLMTERLVEKYGVTREEQDEVAFRSHDHAVKTWEKGAFDYIATVEIHDRKKGTIKVQKDEGPKSISLELLSSQKPYFKPDGTITAMNSSSINDGAAALLIMSETKAQQLSLKPLALLEHFGNIGVPRELMGEGAFKIIPHLLDKSDYKIENVDYFEINEAFAAVVAAAYKDIPGLDRDKTNLWGSGISIGHPVGCTGARQIVDMAHQLRKNDKRIGMTTRCVGGGMGSGEIVTNYE